MTTNSADLNDLIDEFAFLDDWEDRYRHVIEIGRALEPLAPQEATDETRVAGCASQVWLIVEDASDGTLQLRAQSDAHIVQGLAALLVRIYSGRTPREVLEVDMDALMGALGLHEHLSAQRANGFRSMIARVREAAQTKL